MLYSTPGTELVEDREGHFQERAVVLPPKAGGPALELVSPKHSADYDPVTTYK